MKAKTMFMMKDAEGVGGIRKDAPGASHDQHFFLQVAVFMTVMGTDGENLQGGNPSPSTKILPPKMTSGRMLPGLQLLSLREVLDLLDV